MNHSPEGAQGSANSKTPLTDKFYGCPPPESGKDWQTRGTRQERDFARQLERQLAQSEERVAKLEGALASLANDLEYAEGEGSCPGEVCGSLKDQARAVLAAMGMGGASK